MTQYRFMAPEFAGCNGKLSYEETRCLRAELNDVDEDILDHAIMEVSDARYIFTSVDNTGRFCNDLGFFSRAALNHAARDLLNARPDAIVANVHFCFGNDLMLQEDRRNLVNAFASACRDFEITLGKCHSSKAEITQLCISLTGSSNTAPNHVSPCHGDIYLSHPIGAFRQIFLAEQGHSVDHYDNAKRKMELDYRPLVRDLHSGISLCSDVSGFGLSGTLADVAAKHILHIEIAYEAIPFYDVSEYLKEVICIQSDQPREMIVSSGDPHGILNLREVAGPIVILVNTDRNLRDQFASHHFDIRKIGTFRKSQKSEVVVC